MGYTLNDFLKGATTPLRAGVIQNLLRYSDLIGLVPFEGVNTLKVKAMRLKTLPDVYWRDLNETAYQTGTAKFEEIEEALYDLGHYVDIERLFMEAEGAVVDPMQSQINAITKGMAFEFNDKFINGAPTVDTKAVWGLKYRISKLPASQTINYDAGLNGTGASTHVLANSAAKLAFLNQIDGLLDAVGGTVYHENVDDARIVLMMNKKTFAGIRGILRDEKLYSTTQDQFGRRIFEYAGARLIDVGLKSDKTTEIILNTEDPGNADSDATSIYAVRLGTADDECFMGINMYPIKVQDIGLLQSGTHFRTVINWPIGFLGLSDYYAARLKGFTMGA